MNQALIRHINETLSLADEWEIVFGKAPNTGNVFCPFHANKETPAAKIYGNKLHCFSCQKNYSVYHLLSKFNPERIKEVARSYTVPQMLAERAYGPIEPVLNDGVLINVLRRIINRGIINKNGK